METYENLCREMESELKILDNKYATKHGMEKGDVELARELFHALKCKASWLKCVKELEAMEQEGKRWEEGMSAQRRNMDNGHYMSGRDMDGYSMHGPYDRGYSIYPIYRDARPW